MVVYYIILLSFIQVFIGMIPEDVMEEPYSVESRFNLHYLNSFSFSCDLTNQFRHISCTSHVSLNERKPRLIPQETFSNQTIAAYVGHG